MSPASQTVTPGGNAVISITPDTGYYISSITDTLSKSAPNIINAASTYQYVIENVKANHAVTVTFAPDTVTVTAMAGANGTISPATPSVGDKRKDHLFHPHPQDRLHDKHRDRLQRGPVRHHLHHRKGNRQLYGIGQFRKKEDRRSGRRVATTSAPPPNRGRGFIIPATPQHV